MIQQKSKILIISAINIIIMKINSRYEVQQKLRTIKARQSRLSTKTIKTQPNYSGEIKDKIQLMQHKDRLLSTPKRKNKYYRKLSNQVSKILKIDTPQKSHFQNSYIEQNHKQENQDDDDYYMAKDYLTQLEKAKAHKQLLYSSFRYKFLKKFPQMKKMYSEQTLQNLQMLPLESKIVPNEFKVSNRQQKMGSLRQTKLISSTISTDKIQSKIDKHNKKIMNEVYKICHFYSKSKNVCLSNKYQPQTQQYVRPPTPRPAKFNYMEFIRGRKKFNKIREKTKSRAVDLITNQNAILSLEQQGTKAFKLLKRCYDDALENAFILQ